MTNSQPLNEVVAAVQKKAKRQRGQKVGLSELNIVTKVHIERMPDDKVKYPCLAGKLLCATISQVSAGQEDPVPRVNTITLWRDEARSVLAILTEALANDDGYC